MTLSLTKLRKLYPKNLNLSVLFDEKEHLESRLWRLSNIYPIIDKDSNEIIMRMTYAQHAIYAATFRHRRNMVLKSRQQGITTLFLALMLDQCLIKPHQKCGLIALKTTQGSELLQKILTMYTNMDSKYKSRFPAPNFKKEADEQPDQIPIKLIKSNNSLLLFNNNSEIKYDTTFRGLTRNIMHITEIGYSANSEQKLAETQSGTIQSVSSKGIVTIESTSDGDNRFKDMWYKNTDNKIQRGNRPLSPFDFNPIFLSWTHDKDCSQEQKEDDTLISTKYFEKLQKLNIPFTPKQKNFWIAKYREMGDKIYQDYPATPEDAFLSVQAGEYYKDIFINHVINKNQILDGIPKEKSHIQISIDIGSSCNSVALFFYVKVIKNIPNYFFINELVEPQNINTFCNKIKDIIQENQYNAFRIIVPHDTKHITAQSEKPILDSIKNILIYPNDKNSVKSLKNLPKTSSVLNDIFHCQKELPYCHFYRDYTTHLIKALLNYRRSKDKSSGLLLSKKPFRSRKDGHHDLADAFRYALLGRMLTETFNTKHIMSFYP